MKRVYKWCGEKGTLFCTYLTFWLNIINYWLSESVFFTTNNLTDAKKYFSIVKWFKNRWSLLLETAQTTKLRKELTCGLSLTSFWKNEIKIKSEFYASIIHGLSSKKNNSCLHAFKFLGCTQREITLTTFMVR